MYIYIYIYLYIYIYPALALAISHIVNSYRELPWTTTTSGYHRYSGHHRFTIYTFPPLGFVAISILLSSILNKELH